MRVAWNVAASLGLLLGASALATAKYSESGPTPRFAVDPQAPETLGPGLHIAGSGACLATVRELIIRFESSHPERRVVLHPSIGSTGAAQAVSDGVIQIGLMSRPLRSGERGLERLVLASVPVVLIANEEIADTNIRSSVLYDFARLGTWSDGTPRLIELRERGDSGQSALAEALPRFGEALSAAQESGQYRAFYNDEALTRAVRRTRGAIGVSDLVHAARSGVRVLSLDGIAANDPRYPIHREIAAIWRTDASAEILEFASFLDSEEARETISGVRAAEEHL